MVRGRWSVGSRLDTGGRTVYMGRSNFDAIGRERMEAVGNGAGMPGQKFGQARIVRAEENGVLGLRGEGGEFLADGLEVGVVVEVFLVHVEDDRVDWAELAQAAIAFIGLDGEPALVARRQARVSLELRHERAYRVAWVGRQLVEGEGEQGGGGGLAVHAGDAEAALAMEERGQQDGAPHDGHRVLAGELQFRVVEPDGVRVNHQHPARARSSRAAAWPTWSTAPRPRSCCTSGLAARSEPATRWPRSSSRWPRPLMPQPPAPIR